MKNTNFQFHIKSDGSRVKKKVFNSIGRKNSLIHVHKKISQNLDSIQNLPNWSNKSNDVIERILLLENQISSMQIDHNEPSYRSDEVKQQISDLSDSLKLHSRCLKRMKCEDFPKISSIQSQLSDALRNYELQQIKKSNKMMNAIKVLQKQISSINQHVQELENNFDIYKNEISSQIVDSDLEKFLKKSSTILSSSTHNKRDPTDIIEHDKLHSISTTLDEVQKQITSQSICMHQFIRDLGLKIDRCEFEIYSRELSDIIDSVMQLKRDVQCYTSCSPASVSAISTNVNMITTNTSQTFMSFKHPKAACHKKLKRVTSPRCLTPFFKNRYRLNPYYRNL